MVRSRYPQWHKIQQLTPYPRTTTTVSEKATSADTPLTNRIAAGLITSTCKDCALSPSKPVALHRSCTLNKTHLSGGNPPAATSRCMVDHTLLSVTFLWRCCILTTEFHPELHRQTTHSLGSATPVNDVEQ